MRAARSLAAVLAVLMVGLALPAAAHGTRDLVSLPRWAADVEVLGLSSDDSARVQGLWEEFVAGMPAQAPCLLTTPPRIEAKANMRPRAAYSPSGGTLFVKPGDLDRLVVFHELAHHLDFTCGGAEEIGDDLRAAQGIPASKPWWQHGAPVTWPAEYFANAVAIALGEHSRHGVTAEAVEVVEGWMRPPAPVATAQAPPLLADDPGPDVPRLL